jgi:hypothetical protein
LVSAAEHKKIGESAESYSPEIRKQREFAAGAVVSASIVL